VEAAAEAVCLVTQVIGGGGCSCFGIYHLVIMSGKQSKTRFFPFPSAASTDDEERPLNP
jgi:hypothetical protein